MKAKNATKFLTGIGLTFGPIVAAIDPCYTRDVECAKWDINVKSGEYQYKVEYSDEIYGWGERVKSLAIFHNSIKISDSNWQLDKTADIGVDSGQAGFFDNSIIPVLTKEELKNKRSHPSYNYSDENSFYKKCCNLTGSKNKFGILESKAIVSASGYGDGGYSLYYKKNSENEIVALKIKYI